MIVGQSVMRVYLPLPRGPLIWAAWVAAGTGGESQDNGAITVTYTYAARLRALAWARGAPRQPAHRAQCTTNHRRHSYGLMLPIAARDIARAAKVYRRAPGGCKIRTQRGHKPQILRPPFLLSVQGAVMF